MNTNTQFVMALGFVTALCFTTAQTASAQCRDPWITSAYRDVLGRAPQGEGEIGECNIKLYNYGSWNNYNELKGYVREFRSNAIKVAYKDLGDGKFVMVVSVDGVTAVNLMDKNGNTIATGGQLISNDPLGSGFISTNGGNLISTDKSTLKVDKNTPGFSFTGSYSLTSGRRIKTSGRGGLKIQ